MSEGEGDTSIVVVFIDHPEYHRENLEDVEWMQNLLHQQNMVWFHRNINGVLTIAPGPADITCTLMRISTNHNSLGCEQPSRPRCRTITQCAGCVSANARPLQLRWGDRECGCFTSCTCIRTDVHTCECLHAFRAHTSFKTCLLNLVVTRSVFSKCPGQFITRCACVKLVRACTRGSGPFMSGRPGGYGTGPGMAPASCCSCQVKSSSYPWLLRSYLRA